MTEYEMGRKDAGFAQGDNRVALLKTATENVMYTNTPRCDVDEYWRGVRDELAA